MADNYEHVYTVTDYRDGPRGGVADYDGQPHAYRPLGDDSEEQSESTYLLRPLEPETLELVLEDWSQWERWRTAFDEKRTTIATHPVLPEDRDRHEESEPLLTERLAIDPGAAIRAVGDFLVVDGEWKVRGKECAPHPQPSSYVNQREA